MLVATGRDISPLPFAALGCVMIDARFDIRREVPVGISENDLALTTILRPRQSNSGRANFLRCLILSTLLHGN